MDYAIKGGTYLTNCIIDLHPGNQMGNRNLSPIQWSSKAKIGKQNVFPISAVKFAKPAKEKQSLVCYLLFT